MECMLYSYMTHQAQTSVRKTNSIVLPRGQVLLSAYVVANVHVVPGVHGDQIFYVVTFAFIMMVDVYSKFLCVILFSIIILM